MIIHLKISVKNLQSILSFVICIMTALTIFKDNFIVLSKYHSQRLKTVFHLRKIKVFLLSVVLQFVILAPTYRILFFTSVFTVYRLYNTSGLCCAHLAGVVDLIWPEKLQKARTPRDPLKLFKFPHFPICYCETSHSILNKAVNVVIMKGNDRFMLYNEAHHREMRLSVGESFILFFSQI